jgi:NADH dehydrogenase
VRTAPADSCATGPGDRRVVIAGGGYAGVTCAKRLAARARPGDGLEIVLIEPNPCQQALSELDLVSVGPARAEFCEVWYPKVFGELPVTVCYDRVADVFPSRNEVVLGSFDGPRVGYWRLVIATGAVPWVPPVPGLAQRAITMWSVHDAQKLQSRTGQLLKVVATLPTAAERRRALSFVVVGGGATGVEIMGTLAQRLPAVVAAAGVDPAELTLTLIEGRPDILYDLPPVQRGRAVRRLETMGVQVRTGSPLAYVTPDDAMLEDGTVIPASIVVVATGAKADPHALEWGLPHDNAGRLTAGPQLRSPVSDAVFVIGDIASARDPKSSRTLPMLAQMAIQEGPYVADALLADARGQRIADFVPHIQGEFVSVGPRWGVGWMFGANLTGLPAIVMKRITYVKYWLQVGGLSLARKRLREMLKMGW